MLNPALSLKFCFVRWPVLAIYRNRHVVLLCSYMVCAFDPVWCNGRFSYSEFNLFLPKQSRFRFCGHFWLAAYCSNYIPLLLIKSLFCLTRPFLVFISAQNIYCESQQQVVVLGCFYLLLIVHARCILQCIPNFLFTATEWPYKPWFRTPLLVLLF